MGGFGLDFGERWVFGVVCGVFSYIVEEFVCWGFELFVVRVFEIRGFEEEEEGG